MQVSMPPGGIEAQNLRVALVHDYLIQDGGGERVLSAFQEMFPEAPTFALFYDPDRAHPEFRKKEIRTSHLQRWPFSKGREQWALPFMPVAIEHLDFSGYDLVISSSIAFAKGVIVPPGTLHVCYLHTPTRFLWEDRMSYLNDLPQPRFIKRILPMFLHRMRIWDRLAAERPDAIITNSQISRHRIRHHYQRESLVIYPPVDVSRIPFSNERGGSHWVTGGRLVAYKRFDLTVKAFAKLRKPLIVFGVGPELSRLKRIAGPDTKFVGHVSDEEKIRLLSSAIGFINPQIEDFGITAVEAMAAGKPVIAFGVGGARETVIPNVTGIHLEIQSWEDIGDAVIRWNADAFDPATIRAHAEQFSKEQFQERFQSALSDILLRRTYG